MVTIFGTTYYTIGTGLVVLALLAPLLFWLSRWLLRPNVEDAPRRVRLLAEGGLTLGLLLLAAVGLYWDVYLIGQRAKELCEETGLVVYRTASAKGFLGSSAIDVWSHYGFAFVETDYFGKKHRYEMAEGKSSRMPVSALESRYRLDLVDTPTPRNQNGVEHAVIRRGAKISSLDGNDIMAELVEFTVRYGWLDQALIELTGFVAHPRTCGRRQDGSATSDIDRIGINELVLATLKPN